jgi:hypothetical protein
MVAETYVRRAGQHVAERVRPALGSPDAQRLAAAADDPESPWQREDVPVPGSAPLAARPPQAAPKDDWVSWAVACGAGEVAADLMTKQQLIEQYGRGDA